MFELVCETYVNQLNTSGHNDWRIPTILELYSIYDDTVENVLAWDHDSNNPLHLDNRFADGAAYWYWSRKRGHGPHRLLFHPFLFCQRDHQCAAAQHLRQRWRAGCPSDSLTNRSLPYPITLSHTEPRGDHRHLAGPKGFLWWRNVPLPTVLSIISDPFI